MKQYWERARATVDDMSLRERTMIFIAAAFLVISLMYVLLLDPLLARQKFVVVAGGTTAGENERVAGTDAEHSGGKTKR